ncbi:unnamed protein product, partial [Symbiodinium pilosum]
ALSFLIISLHLFEDVSVISSTHQFEVSFPQMNFDKCHDGDFDCDDVGNKSVLQRQRADAQLYCSDSTLKDLSRNMSHYFFDDSETHKYSKTRWKAEPNLQPKCKQFDKHGIFHEDGPAPLLMTARTIINQTRCGSELQIPDCIWENTDAKVEIVYDIERFLVKLRHNVVLGNGEQIESKDATGFLKFPDDPEQLRVIKCDPGKEKCDYSLPSHADYPACGSTSSDAESPCFTTGFADFISLKTLLRAANTSLDEIIADLPRRWWGTYLQVDIQYANDDLRDYWLGSFPSLQLRQRYVYSVRKLTDYVWNAETQKTSQSERRLIRHAGIRIMVAIHGSWKHWNWLNVLRTLAIFGVLWKITVVLVDILTLKVYGQLPGLRHLPHLRHYYSVTETPHHDHVKTLSHEELEREKKQYRQQKLKQIIREEEEDEAR